MQNESLYLLIYTSILAKIKQGVYSENSSLPSERELCDLYHVSRSTIRQALILLQSDGYIYKIHGKGSYIKPQVFEQTLHKFYSFTDELKRSNVYINNKIISCELIPLDTNLALLLNREKGEMFHKISRLRTAGDSPLMIEITYLPQSRFYRISLDILEKGSLYNYLNSTYSLKVDRAIETFRPVIPNPWQCNLLKISPKIPCTLLERFSYEEDCLIEYTFSIVRGDKYVFKVNLSNN